MKTTEKKVEKKVESSDSLETMLLNLESINISTSRKVNKLNLPQYEAKKKKLIDDLFLANKQKELEQLQKNFLNSFRDCKYKFVREMKLNGVDTNEKLSKLSSGLRTEYENKIKYTDEKLKVYKSLYDYCVDKLSSKNEVKA